MQERRYKAAQGYLDDAKLLFDAGRFESAVARAYYAGYQTMWAVLGDPGETKVWRHLGIIQHFVRGYWYQSDHPSDGPGLLEQLRLPLRRLYDLRIDVDYDAAPVTAVVAGYQIRLVEQVWQEVKNRLGSQP